MRVRSLIMEYHENKNGEINKRYKLELYSTNLLQYVEVSENDFCDLMKEMTRANLIGLRSKKHFTEYFVQLKYQTVLADENSVINPT